jgi:hypothetical protein
MVLRFASLLTWAVWVGGFLFHSAVEVPVLHEHLDSFEAGAITQQVTDILNLMGLVAVGSWGVLGVMDRPAVPSSRWLKFLRGGSWLISCVLLLSLFVLHDVMDRLLEEGPLSRFYPWHRLYLRLSTALWLSNLAQLLTWVVSWTPRGRPCLETTVAGTPSIDCSPDPRNRR